MFAPIIWWHTATQSGSITLEPRPTYQQARRLARVYVREFKPFGRVTIEVEES